MTGPARCSISLVLILLSCIALLAGCNGGQARSSEGDSVPVVSPQGADQRTDLLKRLGRKFENPDVHFELGQSYYADGLWDKAKYHYDIALRFDPGHRPAQAAMVKLLLDSGNQSRAVAHADMFMRQVGSSSAESLKLGKAFRNQKVDNYALACYQQALGLSPDSADVYREMGYYYLNKGDKDVAKEYFKRSFRLDPKQPSVAGELGRLGVEVRIPREAEEPG